MTFAETLGAAPRGRLDHVVWPGSAATSAPGGWSRCAAPSTARPSRAVHGAGRRQPQAAGQGQHVRDDRQGARATGRVRLDERLGRAPVHSIPATGRRPQQLGARAARPSRAATRGAVDAGDPPVRCTRRRSPKTNAYRALVPSVAPSVRPRCQAAYSSRSAARGRRSPPRRPAARRPSRCRATYAGPRAAPGPAAERRGLERAMTPTLRRDRGAGPMKCCGRVVVSARACS